MSLIFDLLSQSFYIYPRVEVDDLSSKTFVLTVEVRKGKQKKKSVHLSSVNEVLETRSGIIKTTEIDPHLPLLL